MTTGRSNPGTDTPTPETEAIRRAYAALNRSDIPGFMALFHPEIERIEPSDVPGGGIYRGLDAVRAHIEKGRGSWAEGGCEPDRFIIAGDRIIAIVRVRVRLKHETAWREGQIGDAFIFRDGRAILFRTFPDERQALEWAGVSAPG